MVVVKVPEQGDGLSFIRANVLRQKKEREGM